MASTTQMGSSLRQAVLERLEDIERVAAEGQTEALLPLARTELQRLTDGWRVLLTLHQADEHGRCRACRGGLRPRRWPCPVWATAQRHLLITGMPSTTETADTADTSPRIPKQPRVTLASPPVVRHDTIDPAHWDTEEFPLPHTVSRPAPPAGRAPGGRIHRASVIMR